jgi:hypothetical protein
MINGDERSTRIAVGSNDVDGKRPLGKWFFPSRPVLGSDVFDAPTSAAARARWLVCRSGRDGTSRRCEGRRQQRHELPLEGAMVPRRAFAKLAQKVCGDILDG